MMANVLISNLIIRVSITFGFHKSLPLDYEPLPMDFICSLEQVLGAYMGEVGMDIDSTAKLCNMSKRSLQRKLEKLGTRYSVVLDHARFHVAARLLQDPDTKVTDIAHRLNYSDMSHFSRSFHRISGVSPCEYRLLHATQCKQPALLATG